jgi:hypothetical protein
MNTLEEYTEFAAVCEEAVLRDDVDSMKWISLARTRQFIQNEMYQLAYYVERSKTNPDCIPLREMYRLSIMSTISAMKKTIHELQFKY